MRAPAKTPKKRKNQKEVDETKHDVLKRKKRRCDIDEVKLFDDKK